MVQECELDRWAEETQSPLMDVAWIVGSLRPTRFCLAFAKCQIPKLQTGVPLWPTANVHPGSGAE